MITDSRYFPWLQQLYTASDHRHGRIIVDGFLMAGSEAYRKELRADKEEQLISIPELWGSLNLAKVADAMVMAGMQNPIPVDWQWLADFSALMPSSLEGQGVDIDAYWPVTKHFGIGGSVAVMKLNSLVRVVPTPNSSKKLSLDVAGNQAQFKIGRAHV